MKIWLSMMRWKSIKKVSKCAKTRLKKLLYRLPIFVVLESQTIETPLCYVLELSSQVQRRRIINLVGCPVSQTLPWTFVQLIHFILYIFVG